MSIHAIFRGEEGRICEQRVDYAGLRNRAVLCGGGQLDLGLRREPRMMEVPSHRGFDVFGGLQTP